MSQNKHLQPALYQWLLDHNPPVDPLVQELVDETAAMGSIRGMQVGIDQAMFLGFMVGLLQARFVVEVGTFTGLSSLMMARALPTGGRVLCCDVSEEYTSTARQYWERDGVADRIELVVGPGHDTLESLPDDLQIDLAFVDADKEGYVGYYEQIVPRLSPHGVLIADNLFMGGRVLEGAAPDMVSYASHIRDDPRTETVLVSIGDGFSMTRLKG